jgi:hypothetical protein
MIVGGVSGGVRPVFGTLAAWLTACRLVLAASAVLLPDPVI